MADAEDILVIGAGPAGLAVSACLRERGLPHVVLERETEVGSAWRRHYERLHLHTVKRHSGLPLMPWADSAPRYPAREQVVEYLDRYARQHDVRPRFGVTVNRIERRDDRFSVDTDAGALSPRFVVMATGYNGVPRGPPFPGLDRFAGSVVHAGEYRNAAAYRGKRTLVVGCGNSGAEIALDLAEHAVEVSMVVRGPVHVVPREIFGRPTQQTGILLSRLPRRLADLIAGVTMRLATGDLSRWGIVRPRMGPTTMIERTGRIPLIDVGTIAMVRQGRIGVVPGVDEVFADSARFADGATRPFDAIVLATGYSPGLERVVAGFDAIADARGRPDRFGDESGIPGLFFVGFRNPSTGALREIALEAPRAAAAIASRAGANNRPGRH